MAQYAALAADGHSASPCALHNAWKPSGNVFRRFACALAFALPMMTVSAATSITDCDAPATARLLQPSMQTAVDARAYWLDASTLQWPGKPATGRYRLLRSRDAALVAAVGKPVRGADAVWPVVPSAVRLDAGTATRFEFIPEGMRARLDATVSAHVRASLDAQWLLVQEDLRGRVIDVTGLQWPGLLDAVFDGDHADLGLHVDSESTRFGLWAPTAGHVAVCLYDSEGGAATALTPMHRDNATGAWHLQRDGDLRGAYYTFLVDVMVPGVGLVRNRVTDPYSVALSTDSVRSSIQDLDDVNNPALAPPGWAGHARPEAPASNVDMTFYELHVRDFSASDASVPAAHQGKYLAFTDLSSNGMRHLRALREAGLTDLHLLPVFDIATVPEHGCVTPALAPSAPDSPAAQAAIAAVASRDCFNWGYDPYHFGVPEGSYASTPKAHDDAAAVRIREFRDMVQALHGIGLRVGMDVVYNHTTTSGQAATSVLDRIVPGYYHRLDANGAVTRSTCCENTATEHRMMARLMADTLVVWARQYGIDSFRFDLMGHQPRAAMEAVQQRLRREAGRAIPLIGEGWNFGEVANGARFVQASQGALNGTGIATFSDRARDALRGGGCCDSGRDLIAQQGWLNGLVYAPNAQADPKRPHSDLMHAADLIRAGLAGTLQTYSTTFADGRIGTLAQLDYKGAPAGYASQPAEVVNYVENHDNLTLFDLGALRLPSATSREDRARVQALGIAVVALSQGLPYYHAGIDVLRSKSLDRNSFDSGDAFNRLDWTYTDNGFGLGLPRAADNEKDWPLLAPVLRDGSIRPTSKEIGWTRDVFRDWLRIRATTPLLRLRTADEVQRRLRFLNVGPAQNPAVIVGHLDGSDLPGAGAHEVLYVVNASPQPQTLSLPSEAGKHYVLHPLQRSGADERVRGARFEPDGRVAVPGRTAAVFVVE